MSQFTRRKFLQVTGGAVAPGDSRVYQLWYRDPALSPCGTGSNLSSALLVQWS